jgi:hypothetical protein
MMESISTEPEKAVTLCFHLEELSRYSTSDLQHQVFVADDKWWLLSRKEGIHEGLRDSMLLVEQLGYKNKDDQMIPKLKLSVLLKNKFVGVFRTR